MVQRNCSLHTATKLQLACGIPLQQHTQRKGCHRHTGCPPASTLAWLSLWHRESTAEKHWIHCLVVQTQPAGQRSSRCRPPSRLGQLSLDACVTFRWLRQSRCQRISAHALHTGAKPKQLVHIHWHTSHSQLRQQPLKVIQGASPAGGSAKFTVPRPHGSLSSSCCPVSVFTLCCWLLTLCQ